MGLTLSCPGAGLPALPGSPDPDVFTDAVARYQALAALEEFRRRLHAKNRYNLCHCPIIVDASAWL